jgi:ATP-binding cassette subfamily F protein uup
VPGTGPRAADTAPLSSAGSARSGPRQKLSYREQRELADLPERIEALESEQRTLSAQLADPSTYTTPGADIRRIRERFDAIETELMHSLERWSELETRTAG